MRLRVASIAVLAAAASLAIGVPVLADDYPPVPPVAGEPFTLPRAAAPRVQSYPLRNVGLTPTPPLPACGVIANCSFENALNGWATMDVAGAIYPVGVHGGGQSPGYGLFSSAPTSGSNALLTGWDGNGPGDIAVSQDIILEPTASRLEFDYRAGWDLLNFTSATLPRTFSVQLQPGGGGPPLSTTTVLSASPGSMNLDTGNLLGSVDVAAYAGRSVRVLWIWRVPESFTGPAFFQLDNIRVSERACPIVTNCSFETSDLTGWTVTDIASPTLPAQVRATGTPLQSVSCQPTEGAFAFTHGWNGAGPGDILLSQVVSLPASISSLEFDYRASWSLAPGSAPARSFQLEVQPAAGGAPLASHPILLAAAGSSQADTGPRTAILGLAAFAGQTVRIVFRWHVPAGSLGPADFQLDRIRFTQGHCADILNCSFETGVSPAWTVADLGQPLLPVQAAQSGATPGYGLFLSDPTDGSYAMLHGFDGDGPGDIRLTQLVTLPLWGDQLRFDYRAGWDLATFGGATQPRSFLVSILPEGAGPPLLSQTVLVAAAGTQVLDTGPRSRALSIGALAGQTVRIEFRWHVPEYFTGPAFFQLDRVMIDNVVLAVGPGGGPGQRLELQPARPNPSRESTTFAFTLPQLGDVELEIVDVRGARVWSERHEALPAGEHRLGWSGRTSAGRLAPAGVYYARVRAPGTSTSRMFVRVR